MTLAIKPHPMTPMRSRPAIFTPVEIPAPKRAGTFQRPYTKGWMVSTDRYRADASRSAVSGAPCPGGRRPRSGSGAGTRLRRRGTHDKLRREHVVARRRGWLFDPPDHRSHRHLSDLVRRLMDRRQRDVPQRRKRRVVVPHQRYVSGHVQFVLMLYARP